MNEFEMNYISSDDEVETVEDSDYSEDTRSNAFERCVFTPPPAPDTSAEVTIGYEEHEENDDSSESQMMKWNLSPPNRTRKPISL